ncbi:MAG: CoA-binding protein, partial [Ilumatobacteraceae bacterium]
MALVGATDRSQWSKTTNENLRTFSPGVDVHLVHPRHLEVHGQATVPSLRDLPAPVDLAYLMVPTSAVLEVVGEAAEVGIRNLVILTAGFAETGDEGVERERQLVALIRDHQLTVLGPNGNGFVNVVGGVTPFGLPIQPPLESGPVGVVLQSGGMASVVLTAALGRGIGVSLLVSTGNEAVTSATDVMRYLIA